MKIKIQGNIPKHIMDEVEKLKPSSDPAYWAKKGCKDCAGRGIIGKQTTMMKGNNKIVSDLLCVCARKNYRVWVEKMAAEIKVKNSGDTVESVKEEGKNGNGNGKAKEEKERNLRSRLVALEDAIAGVRVEIARDDKEINSYPHHKILEDIRTRLQTADGEMSKLNQEIEYLDKKATDLMERSQRLLTAAKSLARDATIVQQEKDVMMKTKASEQRVVLQTIQAEYRGVEKDLNSQTHKAKRRRRISEDRLDKLLDRRHRTIREAGFDPVSFAESVMLERDEVVVDS